MKLREFNAKLTERLEEVEKEHANQRSRWAASAEQAEKEGAEMLTKDDLESMRVQLIEQAEAPWIGRVQVLEAELEAARANADTARREAERSRAGLDAASNEYRATLREADVRHQTAVSELRARIEVLDMGGGGRDDDPAAGERGRQLVREHAEATSRSQKLLEEVEDLRRENDGLLREKQNLLAAAAQAQGEAHAARKLSEADRASATRRTSHLQAQLDTALSSQERMHEEVLRGEAQMRILRGQLDEAHHAKADERSAGELRVAEAVREADRLRVEMDRRAMEALRRETMLQRSRDELASTAAASEREAAMAMQSARDDEAARVKRLESERSKLQEQLVAQTSASAATAALSRDRCDALSGEVAALKAELHGASLEKNTAVEEVGRLRRRTDEAEERMATVYGELHALRLESSETAGLRGRAGEAEAEHRVEKERLHMQLTYAQKELSSLQASSATEVQEATARARQMKKLAAKEKAAAAHIEASKGRQIEALKREVARLRGDREKLRLELRGARGAGVPTSVPPPLDATAVSNELRSLMKEEAEIFSQASKLKEEASKLKEEASTFAGAQRE